ncbi:MAG: hypothetical protein VYE40_07965 [Myxococcota bacterium]|nr:hypothetical protein [Myxococcota bacterium]MEC9441018.1 hypothetical protein [Myxococcota bacterium]
MTSILDDLLLPYQKAWLDDRSKRRIWLKGRQQGATWAGIALEGTVILSLNSDDNAASFGTFDSDGASSASGPYARVTLDDTQTDGISVGRYRHQLTVTLSTGVVIKSQVHPITVSEVL